MTLTISSIEELVSEEHRDLVFRFFLVFSRFEYALKRAGFAGGSSADVKPAWDKFSSKYRPIFDPSQTPELQAACDYFSTHPPRKQRVDAGALGWSQPRFRTTEPMLVWLLTAVRSVRNNLFHGGKFPIAPIADPARNPDLLRHALTIIAACLPFDTEVARHFATQEE